MARYQSGIICGICGMKKKKYHWQNNHQSNVNSKFLSCKNCGKKFKVQPARIKSAKYCSFRCKSDFQIGINQSKKTISKRIKNMPDKSGHNNPMWKGGITKLSFLIRNSPEMKFWKIQIIERDDYTCQNTNCRRFGGKLEIHHKVSLSEIIKKFNLKAFEDAKKCKLLWNINNGITYCKRCHAKVDKFRNYFLKGEN